MLIAALLWAVAIAINMRFELWDWRRAQSRDELANPARSLRRRLIFEPAGEAIGAAIIIFLGTRYVAPFSVVAVAAVATVATILGDWRRYQSRKAVEYDL